MFNTSINYKYLLSLIPDNSRILDLGCGDGSLLKELIEKKNITGYGLDISEEMVASCIEKGIPVIQADLDLGLPDFSDKSFDYVILNQTLQAVNKPDMVIKEMLRVGKKCIVAFPNFGYWKIRVFLLFKGKMPVVSYLPHSWYSTPNIHHLTIKDFMDYCNKYNIRIIKKLYFSPEKKTRRFFTNLTASTGIFVLQK